MPTPPGSNLPTATPGRPNPHTTCGVRPCPRIAKASSPVPCLMRRAYSTPANTTHNAVFRVSPPSRPTPHPTCLPPWDPPTFRSVGYGPKRSFLFLLFFLISGKADVRSMIAVPSLDIFLSFVVKIGCFGTLCSSEKGRPPRAQAMPVAL